MKKRQKSRNHHYRRLSRAMVLTMLLVSLTPMFLVSLTILCQFHASYKAKIYDHLSELVLKHSQGIDIFLNEKLADISFLAETFGFENLSNEAFLRHTLKTLRSHYGRVFVDLGVINANGLQVAYAGPFKLDRAQYSNAEWFRKAMKIKYFISDVFLGLRGLPHFIVAVKENWNGEPWILRATIDFGTFNRLVENIHVGKTGFAFIFNTEGELQTKPPMDTILDNNMYMELMKDRKPKGNRVNIVIEHNTSGKKKIYVSTYLKNGDWMMVFEQDYSDAFSDFNRTRRVAVMIIIFGGLGITMTVIILTGKMINRIVKADEEKEQMNKQIMQAGKLASVGELAAGIAHEINNPVAIMMEEAGWIGDLLQEEQFQNSANLEELKRAVGQIRTQGKRCKEITHKLLSFARKTDPRVQDVDVNELIKELIQFSEQRAKYARVTINTRLQEDLPFVRASQSELQQVFLNLINNALDAMEKEGGILNITTHLEGDYLVVEVSDTGPGIPEANLQKIFDPFFTTKPVGKGTGLGLSICYGIIKKMGGEINVKSALGKGTTFTITLPIGHRTASGQSVEIQNTSSVKESHHE